MLKVIKCYTATDVVGSIKFLAVKGALSQLEHGQYYQREFRTVSLKTTELPPFEVRQDYSASIHFFKMIGFGS